MRALVCGLGRMGTFHTTILTELGYTVTTVDPDPNAGADHWTLACADIPGRTYDVACIAVPIPHLARTAAHVAMRFRVKHLLVEKPFASSMLEAAKYAPALATVPHVTVGYVERFNPVITRLIDENEGEHLTCIEFTRRNDRPTPDAKLDLWSHDLDLAHHLRTHGVTFDNVNYTAEGDAPTRTRTIRATYIADYQATYDLMAHDGNPLRLQWESILANERHCATVADAIRVLRTIEQAEQIRAAA